jgi:N utilization substance protein A
LASKLTGWHLDVKSESKYSEAMRSGYNSLMALPGVGVSLADALYEKGFFSAEEISRATIEDLTQIRDIGEVTATKLIQAASEAVEEEENAPDLTLAETPETAENVAETAAESETDNPSAPDGDVEDEKD